MGPCRPPWRVSAGCSAAPLQTLRTAHTHPGRKVSSRFTFTPLALAGLATSPFDVETGNCPTWLARALAFHGGGKHLAGSDRRHRCRWRDGAARAAEIGLLILSRSPCRSTLIPRSSWSRRKGTLSRVVLPGAGCTAHSTRVLFLPLPLTPVMQTRATRELSDRRS